ncbi:MAG TPA: hypothetical protein EYP14_14045, partial [Planctomycetaceae bacterium]|nr:hypothetical protein [Planctomycetaceae bacterium]
MPSVRVEGNGKQILMIDWIFDPKSSELLIRTPYTPRPWINYLTDGRYCALVSQTGGGFSFFLDPSHHVISRREQDLLLNDRPGRFLYIQDAESGDFWNVGGSPARRPLDQFECRHGFGWTQLCSVCQRIGATISFFVPGQTDAEVWLIRIRNGDNRPRRLRVVAYSEWLLGNSLVDPVARRFDSFFKQVEIIDGVVLGRKLVWGIRGQRANRPWPYEVFGCTAGRPEPETIWLEKEEFIGLYRDLAQPQALGAPDRRPEPRRELWGVDVIYGPQWSVSLRPGQCAEWAVVIGIAPSGEGEDRARQLADLEVLRDQLEATRTHWRRRVERVQVRTPDVDLNAIQNRWTPYQVIIKSYLSSAPSYYHASDGSPGFRDALQDAFGLCLVEPERARRMILRLAEFQFADGRASHRAPRVPLPPERSEKSDLPLWLSLPTLQYVRETGDRSIITESVPFADGPEAPLLEHIRRGLERSLEDVGASGLPLIHYGDWNDALDGLGGKGQGESVFLGQFLVFS